MIEMWCYVLTWHIMTFFQLIFCLFFAITRKTTHLKRDPNSASHVYLTNIKNSQEKAVPEHEKKERPKGGEGGGVQETKASSVRTESIQK